MHCPRPPRPLRMGYGYIGMGTGRGCMSRLAHVFVRIIITFLVLVSSSRLSFLKRIRFTVGSLAYR